MEQYYRDDSDDGIVQSKSFKFKINATGKTPGADNKRNFKIAALLKYLLSTLNNSPPAY